MMYLEVATTVKEATSVPMDAVIVQRGDYQKGRLCERLGSYQRSLQFYTKLNDIKRVIVKIATKKFLILQQDVEDQGEGLCLCLRSLSLSLLLFLSFVVFCHLLSSFVIFCHLLSSFYSVISYLYLVSSDKDTVSANKNEDNVYVAVQVLTLIFDLYFYPYRYHYHRPHVSTLQHTVDDQGEGLFLCLVLSHLFLSLKKSKPCTYLQT